MQIHRQTEPRLHPRRQSQIRRTAPVEHQGVAHGTGGAVQIQRHRAGITALRPEGRQQRSSTLNFQLGAGRVSQQLGSKGAVQIPLDVAAIGDKSLGIADLQLQIKAC